MVASKRSLMPFFALWFIVSSVLSTEETANPGVVYVLTMAIPMLLYGATSITGRLKPYHTAALLMFIVGIFSTIIGPYGLFDIRTISKYFLFVLVFIVLTNNRYSGEDLSKMTRYYVILSAIIAILIILSYFGGYEHIDPEADNGGSQFLGRHSVGITGVYKNPNYLTSFMNVATLVLSYKLFRCHPGRRDKLLCIALVVLFLVSIFLTGTRAALLVFLMVLFIVYYSSLSSFKFYHFAIPIIVVVTLFSIYADQITGLFNLYLGTRQMFEDAGRTDAWGYATSKILENPIFGCGIGSWQSLHGNSYMEYLHNVFLEFTLNQGLIGILFLLFVVFHGFSRTKKKDRFFLYMLLIVTFLPMCFQNGVIAVNFWRFIIINRLIVNYSQYSEKGITELLKS